MVRHLFRGVGPQALGALAALILSLGTLGVSAQSPETFLLVHADLDEWRAGFPGSGLAEIWEDPAVVNWRQTVLPQFLAKIQEESGVDPHALEPHLTGRVAFALWIDPEPTAFGEPQFRAAVAMHQPGQGQALLDLIQSFVPTPERTEIQELTFVTPDTLVLTEDASMAQRLTDALPSGAGALGLPSGPGTFMGCRLNIGTLLATMRSLGKLDTEAEVYLVDAGLAHLDTVTLSSRFSGRGITDEIQIEFAGPRTGLLSLLGPERDFGTLALAPSTGLATLSLSTVPPQQIFDWFRATVAHHEPQALQEIQGFTDEIQSLTGLDFRTQILPALGQEATLAFGGMTGMMLDTALIAEVNDPQPVAALITALVEMANRGMTPPPGSPQPTPTIQAMPMTSGVYEYQLLSIPGVPVQIAWGFIEGRLVVASSFNQMNAICQAASTGQGLTADPTFAAVASEHLQPAVGFSYTDNVAQMRLVGQSILPMMMAAGDVPSELRQTLALVPVIAQHLGQDVAVVTTDPSRILIRAHHSSGASRVAAVPVIAAVAIPNFLEAQTRSRVSRVRADMRSMATALESYYIDNNAYPTWVAGSDPLSLSHGNTLLTEMPTFRHCEPGGPMTLSTPIAYVTRHLEDVFNEDQGDVPAFSYYTDGQGWILTSPGPDLDFDFDPREIYTFEKGLGNPELIIRAFDPTNGTISDGDIYRVRQ